MLVCRGEINWSFIGWENKIESYITLITRDFSLYLSNTVNQLGDKNKSETIDTSKHHYLAVLFFVCSRDSRPRDWSRLGAFFVVSVSPNISRDSRDWGQAFFTFFEVRIDRYWEKIIICLSRFYSHKNYFGFQMHCYSKIGALKW